MPTLMEREAKESPAVVARQLKENAVVWKAVCQRLHQLKVSFAMTVARGSSDNAATFAKYLFEVHMGLPTASAAPSVFTLYGKSLKLAGSLVVGLSQSGQSPDICEVMSSARKSAAITVALVNQVSSPLADIAEFVIPAWAGLEQSVSATKSYIATLTALIQFVAIYSEDQSLLQSLEQLPDYLDQALQMDWSILQSAWYTVNTALVIGRGYGFPIAQEAALKLKETSALHAEAFSSAEVMHGPFELVKDNYPVLVFAQEDATLKGTLSLVDRIVAIGGKVFLAMPEDVKVELPPSVVRLPLPKSLHPLLDPLMAIQAFYVTAARLAVLKGNNPDQPHNLKKVTETR